MAELVKITKSEELMFYKFNMELNDKQTQLFSFALTKLSKEFSEETQREVFVSIFSKAEFCKAIGINDKNYNASKILDDLNKMAGMTVTAVNEDFMQDKKNGKGIVAPLVGLIPYENGIFKVLWNDREYKGERPVEKILSQYDDKDALSYPFNYLMTLNKTGLLVYEYVLRLNTLGDKVKFLKTEQLAKLFKVEGKSKSNIRYLRNRYLNPALENIALSKTDLNIEFKNIYDGKTPIGVELRWSNSYQSFKPATEKQIELGKSLLVDLNLLTPYFSDIKEFQDIKRKLTKYDEVDKYDYGTTIASSKESIKKWKKEITRSGIEKIPENILNQYRMSLSSWTKKQPTLIEKVDFINLCEYFSEINGDEFLGIINYAFKIAEKKEAISFNYINETLRRWKDNSVTTLLEAQDIYDKFYGGTEEKIAEEMENIEISPEFLEMVENPAW